MGRGLAAIIPSSPEDAPAQELRELPIELISANPNQPRRHFDEEALQSLASSLGQQGVLQPVLVRPKPGGTYELIAGERRLRAAAIAKLQTIPALVRPGEDSQTLELALIENMAREDLNPVEEARACAALVEELGLTREEVGVRVGRSRVAISNLIRLLDLPEEALELLEQGKLTEGHGRALLLTEDHNRRRQLAKVAAEERWSVRVLEQRAREIATDEPQRERISTGGPRLHPDQQAAMEGIGEILEGVWGVEVKVRAGRSGGYRVELEFDSLDDARRLAQGLEPQAPA